MLNDFIAVLEDGAYEEKDLEGYFFGTNVHHFGGDI